MARKDAVLRLHQRRHTDFRRGKRLGKRDHVVQWERPTRPTWMDDATYAGMPATPSVVACDRSRRLARA